MNETRKIVWAKWKLKIKSVQGVNMMFKHSLLSCSFFCAM